MSEKRVKKDLLTAKLGQRIEILILRNQGWEFEKIAKKLGVSKQAVHQSYKKIKHMTIEDLTSLYQSLN